MSAEKTAKNSVPGKPFEKGDPRINKNGRPKGSGLSITTEIKRKLEEKPKGKEKTYLQYLIEEILKKAVIEGDSQTIKQLWNYVDGMPPQKMNIEVGEGEKDRETVKQIAEDYKKNNDKKDSKELLQG